jgi:hypothetical protein
MRTEAIFQRSGTGWQTEDGLLGFSGDAGHVYERMLAEHPNVRVGFRSIDLGLAAYMTFGPVLWMKTAEERAHG